MPNYSEAERRVRELVKNSQFFTFDGEQYTPEIVDKPTSEGGEPKTDIYVTARGVKNEIREFKISFKLDDAAFPQNKITRAIAEEHDITQDILDAARELQDEFVNAFKPQNRALIHFERPSCGRGQEKNSRKITLGWKCEANTKTRELAVEVTGERRTRLLRSMYLGTNQPPEKRNASVNRIEIPDSGIPNFMLQSTLEELIDVQSVFDRLESVDDYINTRPDLFLIFTALSYFIDDGYIEQTRELWVWPRWCVRDGLLSAKMVFDRIRIAKEVEQDFFNCIIEMGLDPHTFELEQIRDRIHPDILIHDS